MGYGTLYFTYLWTHSCLSLRIDHGGSFTKPENCSDEIKMPKSTTEYRIKSFIPIENMNVEKLRDSKSNPSKFSKVSLTWIQKSASLRCLLPPTLMFSFWQWFLQTSNNNKRQLDWQLQYLIIWSLNQESSLNLIYIIIVLEMPKQEGFHWPEKSLGGK